MLISARRGDGPRPASDAEQQATEAGREVDYIDAWNRLYLGWAQRLAGHFESARERLEAARAFFKEVSVPAGEIQAEIELAALHLESDRPSRAEKYFRSIRGRFQPGDLRRMS